MIGNYSGIESRCIYTLRVSMFLIYASLFYSVKRVARTCLFSRDSLLNIGTLSGILWLFRQVYAMYLPEIYPP